MLSSERDRLAQRMAAASAAKTRARVHGSWVRHDLADLPGPRETMRSRRRQEAEAKAAAARAAQANGAYARGGGGGGGGDGADGTRFNDVAWEELMDWPAMPEKQGNAAGDGNAFRKRVRHARKTGTKIPSDRVVYDYLFT